MVPLQQALQLLEFVGDTERRPAGRPGAEEAWGSIRSRRGTVAVFLDLLVEDPLHLLRLVDVGEVGLPLLAAGLDHEVPGAHDALEDPLAEVDVVDPGERDLDTSLGEHARPVDDPVRGDDELDRPPVDQPEQGPDPDTEEHHEAQGPDDPGTS